MRALERALCSLLLLATCGPSLHRPAAAQSPTTPTPIPTDPRPQCTGEMLDFRLIHNPLIEPPAPGHLLAILIHNRSLTPCFLPSAELDLLSTTQAPTTQSHFVDYPSPIDRSTDRTTLEPGQFFHIVLAWSSIPERVNGRTILDCATQEELRLHSSQYPDAVPWLIIRNLLIRVCGEFWVSPYRLGPYTANEPILQQWLDRFQLHPSDIVPTFDPAFLTPQQPPSYALTTLSHVRYLKGPAGSGYFGNLTVWLKSHAACPYFSLAKREADGQTLVELNRCEDAAPGPQYTLFEIGLSNLNLLPQRTGHIEYQVETYASRPTARVDTSRVELDIRDSTAPMLPPIDTKLLPCTAAQLTVAPAPVDLGTHWKTPRNYAGDDQQWRDGRAFQVTNTSSENCLLGGMPDVKFTNPPEMTTGSLMLEVCRNCDNPVFAARESHWIDLKPAQTAHFIVSRTVLDARYQGLCAVIGGIDLALPGGGPIRLPFDTANCASVNVSAWREGPFDSDPLNLADNPHPQPDTTPDTATPDSVPAECAKSISADTGQPAFRFPGKAGVWGLSTQPVPFGDPVPLLLWIDNPTDQPISVWTCMDVDYFFEYSFDVFDAEGHRVLDKIEQATSNKSSPPQPRAFSCTNNMPFTIPANTCTMGRFSKGGFKDLSRFYSLSPGTYYVVPSLRTPEGAPTSRPLPDSGPRLKVTITPE